MPAYTAHCREKAVHGMAPHKSFGSRAIKIVFCVSHISLMSIYVVELENKSSAKLFSLEHVCSACTTVNKTSLGTGGEAGPSGKHTLDLPLFKKPG